MTEYRVKINNNLFATLFIGGDKGLVVYAAGLPQYVQKHHSFVSQILEAGYSLCVPRYYGTWESSGEFSVKESIKTLRETLDFVKAGQCKELFADKVITWNTSKIILLGYSFGALPAIRCNTDDIYGTILVCPFLSSKFQSGGENINDSLDFLKKGYPNVYRFDKNVVKNEFDELEFPKKQTKLVVIEGILDKSITKETYKFIKNTYGVESIKEEIGHSVIFKDDYLN